MTLKIKWTINKRRCPARGTPWEWTGAQGNLKCVVK